MSSSLILNAKVINEGKTQELDVFIKNGKIEKIGKDLSHIIANEIIDAAGLYLMPGVIDDQYILESLALHTKPRLRANPERPWLVALQVLWKCQIRYLMPLLKNSLRINIK
jgi:predicted amidohydrolase